MCQLNLLPVNFIVSQIYCHLNLLSVKFIFSQIYVSVKFIVI